MSIIVDGTGSGARAAVTSGNRIKVDAIVEDVYVDAAENGRAFNINTEAVTYSGTGPFEKGCLYVKNNESVDVEVVGWFIGEKGARTGGNTTDPLLFTMYGNPTGNIGGNVINVVNRRIGAPRQFDLECLGSPTSWTVTGSPLLYQYHYSGRAFGSVNFTIPPGQSILLSVSCEADSTTFYTGFTGYVGD